MSEDIFDAEASVIDASWIALAQSEEMLAEAAKAWLAYKTASGLLHVSFSDAAPDDRRDQYVERLSAVTVAEKEHHRTALALARISPVLLLAVKNYIKRRATPSTDVAALVERLRTPHKAGDRRQRAIVERQAADALERISSTTAPAMERYRHKKRGTEYTVIGVGRAQGTLNDEDPVVLYRGDDGGLWVRHQVEFCDGRFERLSNPSDMRA